MSAAAISPRHSISSRIAARNDALRRYFADFPSEALLPISPMTALRAMGSSPTASFLRASVTGAIGMIRVYRQGEYRR